MSVCLPNFPICAFSENGVLGYLAVNLNNNSYPDFVEGESFFTIMGLFFSTVTGILSGINMSGDLHDPFNNIPTGTLSALGVSWVSFQFDCRDTEGNYFPFHRNNLCPKGLLRNTWQLVGDYSQLLFNFSG